MAAECPSRQRQSSPLTWRRHGPGLGLAVQPIGASIDCRQHRQHPGTAVLVQADASEVKAAEPGLLRRAAQANTQSAVAAHRHRDRQVAERHGTKLQREVAH